MSRKECNFAVGNGKARERQATSRKDKDMNLDNNKKMPLLGMTLTQLETVAAECQLPRFAAKQIARRLYVNRATSIDEMTEISKVGRERLAANYEIGRSAPKLETVSADGTKKYLFEGVGNHDIEAVYIPDHDRATLCVSSQAGCKMGCKFCMTGRQGFHGDLSVNQIINQILSIPDSLSLTNIVFMGMGEPMDNYDAVVGAIDILTLPWGMAWSPKRITVSSIGKTDTLARLVENTKVNIAISLHSPFPSEREALMPVEKAYPTRKVIEMLSHYDFAHQRRLSVEYIMWDGINDDDRHCDALARLLRNVDCRVNLIRFHAIPESTLRTSGNERMTAFRDRLNKQGIIATIRASRGEDIMAACGMLAGKKS